MPYLEVRETYGSVQPYAAHFHHTLSVGIILSGSTNFWCCGQDYLARPLDMVLIEPDAVHMCNPVNGRPRSYYMLHLEPAWCFDRKNIAASAGLGLGVRKRLIRRADICVELVNELRELQNTVKDSSARLEQLLGKIVEEYCVLRTANQQLSPHTAILAEGLLPEARCKVKDLAGLCGIRRESYIRQVKKHTGLTPGAYRHCLRLAEARRLLRQGHDISEAALAVGYTDQSHFHRMFVKYYSATPGQYHCRSLSYKK